MSNTGTLYVMATPIGNLGDISIRMKETLEQVDLVVCEDTRVAGKLLHYLGIKKPMISFTNHSNASLSDKLVEKIRDGEKVVLISDAGTPAISDPGSFLVEKVHEAFPDNHKVVLSIPGPSALVSALSISGLPSKEFQFLSFAPQKKGRQTFLKNIENSEMTTVFFESPHRIEKLLEELNKSMPNRKIAIARELTKMFEECVVGTVKEVKDIFDKKKEAEKKGEYTIIIAGK